MRLLIVQYAGDYRESFYRFQAGEDETYFAQKYSVDVLAEFVSQGAEVSTLCCLTETAYDQVLPNGVRAIGAGLKPPVDFKAVINLIAEQKPTHLVIRTPARQLFRWAIKHKIPTLATLADSFPNQRLRDKLKTFLIVRLLNHPQVAIVGNHGVSSSRHLQDIGVKSDKIVPYDFPSPVTPAAFAAKTLRSTVDPAIPLQKSAFAPTQWNLVYVGSIIESKGVGDALKAVAALRNRQFPVTLKLAGRGDMEFFQQQSRSLKLEDCVEFLGLVGNKAVISLMREADAVLVPSRHDYSEGFPFVIREALCSRTPLVASDHPMFRRKLQHRVNAIIFPAGDSMALAAAIETLLSTPGLYQQISQATDAAWSSLQIPITWGDMLHYWDSPDRQDWLFKHRLSAGLYD